MLALQPKFCGAILQRQAQNAQHNHADHKDIVEGFQPGLESGQSKQRDFLEYSGNALTKEGQKEKHSKAAIHKPKNQIVDVLGILLGIFLGNV